jgi:hypothetical protein
VNGVADGFAAAAEGEPYGEDGGGEGLQDQAACSRIDVHGRNSNQEMGARAPDRDDHADGWRGLGPQEADLS